jgi:hypothetical protein
MAIPFRDNTRSFEELDFTLLKDDAPVFHLEIKEKRQPYRADRWPAFAPEPDLCILDDLTVRKCLAFAPAAGILMRDNVLGRYVFFPVIDLALMPKQRVNRPIRNQTADVKGKWLIHFDNGRHAPDLAGAFDLIRAYYGDLPAILHGIHACYGSFVGEEIDRAGSERRPDHWTTDVDATR